MSAIPNDPLPPVSLALEQLGIPHRVFRHGGAITSVEQAARERGQRPEQVVRSIVFRLAADRFIMVLVPGTGQISWKKLRHILGQSRVTMATPDEVERVTGYQIGTVSPFGLPGQMRVLVDRRILLEEEVSVGSGTASTGVILKSADLFRALKTAELADFV